MGQTGWHKALKILPNKHKMQQLYILKTACWQDVIGKFQVAMSKHYSGYTKPQNPSALNLATTS
jgi:hypothetical protein